MKHLLSIGDLDRASLENMLDLALRLKAEQKNGIFHPYLKNKSLGMIFQKASTRTRVSFELGMQQMGGYALYLNGSDMQLGRGESIEDTARVLSRYLDGMMIRTFAQQDIADLARYGSIPVINGLTNEEHPCQVLADLLTIREWKGKTEGLKLCYIGDGNNMCNSLMLGALTAGMEMSIAVPEEYMPKREILEKAQKSGRFSLHRCPKEAVKDADVVVTDVWASMGSEAEAAERKKVFGGVYQINTQLLAAAKKDAMVLHCLPAHRGEEITAEVLEKHAAEIFEEAENRLHVQKAVLLSLLGEA